MSHNHHGHPLLISGIVMGIIAGIFLALPKALRGWLAVAIFVSLVWGGWALVHTPPPPEVAGTNQPVPAAVDYAPRAELVKLPAAPRAELVRLPNGH